MGVLSHEEGAVRPLADEGRIVEPFLQQDVDHAQGKRAVAAGPDSEPAIRLLGQTMLARVDDNESGAPGSGPADAQSGGRFRGLRVVAPEKHAVGVLVVRGWG